MLGAMLGSTLLTIIIYLIFLIPIIFLLYFVIKKAVIDAIKELKKNNIL